MSITLEQIKTLRDQTGAGMADVKKALTESDGDMEAAVAYLRKRGAASAAKRADRDSNEGLILTKTSDDMHTGAIVEVNCETDFVARNDEFTAFANNVLNVVYNEGPADVEAIKAAAIEGGKTIGDAYNEQLAKFSERILIGRFRRVADVPCVVTYTHVGNKLGVMLEADGAPADEAGQNLLRDIAMQIAAMSPGYVDRDAVDADVIAKEMEIYTEQAVATGKPANIAERIAKGRLEKYFQENCLVDQTFVKDSGKTVAEVLAGVKTASGDSIKITGFKRFSLGDCEPSED